MRTSATLSVALLTTLTVAQTPGDTLTMYLDAPGEPLQLDSVYPAGCWQVGTPAKPVFTSAFSPGKALVTDTLLPHPTNTTCYAEYTLLATDFNYVGRTIQYKQWLHMDTTSQASVEVYDPWLMAWRRFGATWDEWAVGLPNDGTGYAWTGSTGAWEDVWLESPCIGVFWNEGEKDAEWYDPLMRVRFVFESQGNPDSLDGWMIDNVRASVSLCSGSVQDDVTASPSLFPLPANDEVNVLAPFTGPYSVEIIETRGAVVRLHTGTGGGTTTFNIGSLNNGVYLARITTATSVTTHRLVVQH